jgi:hypothetical protein
VIDRVAGEIAQIWRFGVFSPLLTAKMSGMGVSEETVVRRFYEEMNKRQAQRPRRRAIHK